MNNDTKYWINVNNVQSGPMSAEELQRFGVSADAYVWRSGLPDWVKITALPEFESLGITFGVEPMPPVMPDPVPEFTNAPETQPESMGEPSVDEPATIVPELPVIEGTHVAEQPQYAQPQYAQPQYAQPQPDLQYQQPAAAYPKCPPTNMVWAVLATILCCIPLGIIAIVYSNKVSKCYYAGDMEGAEHYSEVSAWWCIGTIIGGIVLSPFVSLIQMLLM